MSAKDTANRIFHFIGGLIITIVGIILIIIEFSSESTNYPMFPFIVLIFGLGWIVFAFDKHKKAQAQSVSNSPPVQSANNPEQVQKQNNPQSVQAEHTPPPFNKS